MLRRDFVFLAAAGSLSASALARRLGAAQPSGTPARPTEYEILRRIPAERLRALIGDRPDANGLSGSNRLAGRWLEAGPQRGCCRGVIAGVVLDDLELAEDAWRGIEVAFAHQRDDGGFVANLRPNGKSARPFGAAVETAFFFLQEMGRAVLVIRQSPHEPHFRERLAALEPKIRRAGRFILSGYDTIIDNSSKAVNRIFIAAKAFGLCGLVLRDEEMLAAARRLVTHGLTLRDAQGIFIENGGVTPATTRSQSSSDRSSPFICRSRSLRRRCLLRWRGRSAESAPTVRSRWREFPHRRRQGEVLFR